MFAVQLLISLLLLALIISASHLISIEDQSVYVLTKTGERLAYRILTDDEDRCGNFNTHRSHFFQLLPDDYYYYYDPTQQTHQSTLYTRGLVYDTPDGDDDDEDGPLTLVSMPLCTWSLNHTAQTAETRQIDDLLPLLAGTSYSDLVIWNGMMYFLVMPGPWDDNEHGWEFIVRGYDLQSKDIVDFGGIGKVTDFSKGVWWDAKKREFGKGQLHRIMGSRMVAMKNANGDGVVLVAQFTHASSQSPIVVWFDTGLKHVTKQQTYTEGLYLDVLGLARGSTEDTDALVCVCSKLDSDSKSQSLSSRFRVQSLIDAVHSQPDPRKTITRSLCKINTHTGALNTSYPALYSRSTHLFAPQSSTLDRPTRSPTSSDDFMAYLVFDKARVVHVSTQSGRVERVLKYEMDGESQDFNLVVVA